MKPLIFLLFLILSITANSQIVNIPDPNFKNALLNHELLGGEVIDTNEDGEIQFSEAEAVTELYVGDGFVNMGIQDMTGIEAFVNITKLYCINNYITYLNLTQNTHLQVVDCWKNHLLSLDIRNGNNTNITFFESGQNPNLICIFVDDAEYSENAPNWYKDPASTYVETEAECDALSIGGVFLYGIDIYPNPVEDILNLKLSFEKFPAVVSLLDIRGQEISNFILTEIDTQINLSFLNTGMYFLVFKDQQTKETLTKKLIKR